MGLAENRIKSQRLAEYMRRHGIQRSTGMCPWGCGARIRNGGQALLNHLNVCTGKYKR